MGNIFSWAFKTNKELGNSEIPSIFSLALSSDLFVISDVLNTYIKILTDVAERTHGLDDKQEPALWDSCEQSDASFGVISLLADAMVKQTDLFLVYKNEVVRKADREEEQKIREDYKAKSESEVGVYISFKGYRRTEMLKLYSSFEYCVLASLNKTLNVAKSVQFKINDLRSSVGLNDAGIAREQARSIAEAMKNGNDVLLDAKDTVESATPDTSPTEKAITFLDAKRAFILGLPLSYIVGEQVGGLNNAGEADLRAVERGLRQYFVSIIRPVLNALFDADVEFKSQDFREMTTGLEVLKTFDLTSDEYISKETKRNLAARVFDVDPEEEMKRIEKEEAEREAEQKKLMQDAAKAGAAIGPDGKPVAAQGDAKPAGNGVARPQAVANA